MVHAAGFGIRYRTPIGPIRLDLSYSINPPRFNGFKGTYTDLVNCTISQFLHFGHATDQPLPILLFDWAGFLMRYSLQLALLLLAVPLAATIVDRIAVTVGDQVITETEILREIDITAFLNGEKPSFTPDEKRKAADRLVEQKLVRKEMELGNYPEATTEQAEELLAETEKTMGGRGGVTAETGGVWADPGRLGAPSAMAIDTGAIHRYAVPAGDSSDGARCAGLLSKGDCSQGETWREHAIGRCTGTDTGDALNATRGSAA